MANNKKSKKIALNPKFFITIVDANFYFSVQQAFQALGIQLIDLNNGQIINGNANVDTLGLISKLPPKKEVPDRGNTSHFLFPISTLKHKSFDVEATLNIFEPSNPDDPIVFTVQVINQDDIEFWYKIVAEVGKNYVQMDEYDNLFTTAIFRIVPLAIPNGQDLSAIRTMQGNIQRYRPGGDSSGSSISGDYFSSSDWYDTEDDEEDEPEIT